MGEVVDFIERKYSREIAEVMRIIKQRDFALTGTCLQSAIIFAEEMAYAKSIRETTDD